MAPIRVGLIGLSPNAIAGWARTAHLPYLLSSPDYELKGILNSTLASSEAAIKNFQLPSTTKAFGTMEDLVQDPEIDMVVLCLEVKHHYPLAKVALEHRKMVFSEWPLAVDITQANELAALAAKNNVQTMVDIESRLSPVAVKLRELIASGEIGRMTSTSLVGTFGPPLEFWSKKADFYLDIKSGQTALHTRFSHFLEGFYNSVGEFESYHSLLTTHGVKVKLYDLPLSQLGDVAKDPDAHPYQWAEKTSPDEILLQGKLTNGGVASIHVRSGPNDPDENLLRWLITGTKGVIEVTQSQGQFLRDLSTQIRVSANGSTKIVEVDWDTDGTWKMYGKNVVFANPGRHYKAFAEGDTGALFDFEKAARRLAMLDSMMQEASR